MACSTLALLVLLSTLAPTWSQTQTPKLILIQQVFRHGARYPIYPSNHDGSDFAQNQRSIGELTKQGKAMHYLLGQKLYDTYWIKIFGGTPFQKAYNQSKFYIKSTDVNRTIESAQSQLFGILQQLPQLELTKAELLYSAPKWPGAFARLGAVFGPDGSNFHPTPIHVQKIGMSIYQNGDFLRTYSEDVCLIQNKWMKLNQNSPRAVEIASNPMYQYAVDAVSKALNKSTTFWDIYMYIDNSICMSYLSLTPLDIFTRPSETKRALDSINMIQVLIKLFYTPQQLATTATGFFNATILNLNRIIENPNAEQWIMYSAHDTTIINYLAAMNFTNVQCVYQAFINNYTKDTDSCIVQYPLFTSNIIFELYSYKKQSHTFKIRYNGVYKKIPFCNWNNECSFSTFVQWYNGWKNEKFPQICGVKNSQAQTYFSFAVVEFGIILAAAIGLVISKLKSGSKMSMSPPAADRKKELLLEQVEERNDALMKKSLLSEEIQIEVEK